MTRLCGRRALLAAVIDERGGVAVALALLLFVLLGFVSLGTEVVAPLATSRQMQSAADSAASASVVARLRGYPGDYRAEAYAVATQAGFVRGQGGTTVAVNSPPSLGRYTGDASAVEIIITQPQSPGLASLLHPDGFTVAARAVARPRQDKTICIAALDSSAAKALSLNNNTVVANPNCMLASNSNASDALALAPNATIDAGVNVVGGWSLANGAVLAGTPNLQHAGAVPDPYAAVPLQPIPACTGQSGSGPAGCSVTLNPGHFCGGFNFGNTCTVTLSPGAYYIDSGFSFGNSATLNATGGVTLIINGHYSFSLGNGLTMNLTAPTSGPYAGLAFFGPRDSSPNVQQTFRNGTTLDIDGAIYFPSQTVNFQNNAETGPGGCTQIIADLVTLSNNVYLDNNCAGTGVTPISVLPQLIE